MNGLLENTKEANKGKVNNKEAKQALDSYKNELDFLSKRLTATSNALSKVNVQGELTENQLEYILNMNNVYIPKDDLENVNSANKSSYLSQMLGDLRTSNPSLYYKILVQISNQTEENKKYYKQLQNEYDSLLERYNAMLSGNSTSDSADSADSELPEDMATYGSI